LRRLLHLKQGQNFVLTLLFTLVKTLSLYIILWCK